MRTGGFGPYAAFESRAYALTAGWGAAGYTVGAVAWTWCFAASGLLSSRMKWLSLATWTLFAASAAAAFAPEGWPAGSGQAGSGHAGTGRMAAAVSLGNAAAFVLLMLWLAGVTEAVLRRARPETARGGSAPWRHPSRGTAPRLCDLFANSRLARALGRLLPAAAMASDLRDVVYVNYLVEADLLAPLVTPPLVLQRLGPDGRYAMFTFLTYRHGHFGPARLGPLRRLWPSPIQSNWRLYVLNPETGRPGVEFLTTAITGTTYALATRLLAEGVPMHVPAGTRLDRGRDGVCRLVIDPGSGTAPDVRAELSPAPEPRLAPPWSLCFGSWAEMLRYCVPQDRSLSVRPESGRVVRQEISLDIPIGSCRPLAGRVTSAAARTTVGDAEPMCFVVDRVRFRFDAEEADRVGGRAPVTRTPRPGSPA